MDMRSKDPQDSLSETRRLKGFIHQQGIDLVGVADLKQLEGMPSGMPSGASFLTTHYRYAIVLGSQLDKLGKKASGSEQSLFLEKAALKVVDHLEELGQAGLIIHTEDEYNPIQRIGLLSLKVLAKAAGLGWQGRSLLIIHPDHGPIHRWIAILTAMDLQADPQIPNQCGDCSLCVDKCPTGALTLVPFEDHPRDRSDVLEIEDCLGNVDCMVCLSVCPWAKMKDGTG